MPFTLTEEVLNAVKDRLFQMGVCRENILYLKEEFKRDHGDMPAEDYAFAINYYLKRGWNSLAMMVVDIQREKDFAAIGIHDITELLSRSRFASLLDDANPAATNKFKWCYRNARFLLVK